MRKATKTIISFAVVLIAGLNLIVPALAQDPFTAVAVGGLGGASGAGLFGSMAGMSGINIGYVSDPVNDAMWNKLNPDSVYFSGEKHEASGTGEDVWDYITVDIGDWLSAQSDFIVAFAQEHNIQDDDSGTVTVEQSYAGVPFSTTYTFNHDGSTVLNIPGNISIVSTVKNQTNGYITVYQYGTSVGSAYPRYGTYTVSYHKNNQGVYITVSSVTAFLDSSLYTDGSNVNWDSDTVNTSVFDGWESAKVKIPKNISQLQTGWTLTDFLNELDRIWYGAGEDNIVIEEGGDDPPVPPPPIPSTPVGDVPFNDWINLWGETVTDKQDDTNEKLDLIGSNGHDQIEELQEVNTNLQETKNTLDNINTNVSDIADHVENIDTNIDTMTDDVSNIDNNVSDIADHVDNIDTNIDTMANNVSNIDTNVTDIADHVENIDTNVEDIEDIADSIDTNIGIGNGLLGDIKSLLQSAVDWLESIAENVAELVESVVQATETLIAGILNQIPSVFGVIFGPIKQASSIWHYVVEWIQSISAPMSWIWSMASGTSYNIILPVYASLAGAVVLAFYKRFGK